MCRSWFSHRITPPTWPASLPSVCSNPRNKSTLHPGPPSSDRELHLGWQHVAHANALGYDPGARSARPAGRTSCGWSRSSLSRACRSPPKPLQGWSWWWGPGRPKPGPVVASGLGWCLLAVAVSRRVILVLRAVPQGSAVVRPFDQPGVFPAVHRRILVRLIPSSARSVTISVAPHILWGPLQRVGDRTCLHCHLTHHAPFTFTFSTGTPLAIRAW